MAQIENSSLGVRIDGEIENAGRGARPDGLQVAPQKRWRWPSPTALAPASSTWSCWRHLAQSWRRETRTKGRSAVAFWLEWKFGVLRRGLANVLAVDIQINTNRPRNEAHVTADPAVSVEQGTRVSLREWVDEAQTAASLASWRQAAGRLWTGWTTRTRVEGLCLAMDSRPGPCSALEKDVADVWHVCPGDKSWQKLQTLEAFMSEASREPQSFPDRTLSRACSATSPTGKVGRCKIHFYVKRKKWELAQQDSDLVVAVSVIQDQNRLGHMMKIGHLTIFIDGEWDTLALRMYLMRRTKRGGAGTHFPNEPENRLILVNVMLAYRVAGFVRFLLKHRFFSCTSVFFNTILTEIITDRKIMWRINIRLQIQIPWF